MALDGELYRQNLFFPEYLEDVYDFPDGNFIPIHRGRNIGMGFKQTDAASNVRLYWIKRRDLARFGNNWQERGMGALQRLAIPPEPYAEYPSSAGEPRRRCAGISCCRHRPPVIM